MTRAERQAFVLLALLKDDEETDRENLIQKVEVAMTIPRPEVLLSEKQLKTYGELVAEAKRKGKII